jgi:hypothetical protein
MKRCKSDQILNPTTNRCIKIDGATFTQKINIASLASPERQKIQQYRANRQGANRPAQRAATPSPNKPISPSPNTKHLTQLLKHQDSLYVLCRYGAQFPFDTHSRITCQLKTTVKSAIDRIDADAQQMLLDLQHPKTNETVRTILAKQTVDKALLEVFLYYFVKLEEWSKNVKVEYNIAKGKVVFEKLERGKLYFHHVNSTQDSVSLSNIGHATKIFKSSSLMKTQSTQQTHKCKTFESKCVNKEELYLYTNNYDNEKWCDFKDDEIIKTQGNYCFTIDYLLEYINGKLNSSTMNNPLPAYPVNPFTNEPLTRQHLKKLKQQVILTKTKVPLPVKTFLEDDSLWVDVMNQHNSNVVIDAFERHGLRFKRINFKDSQGNYTGHWVNRNTPWTRFEIHLHDWLQTLNPMTKATIERMPTDTVLYENLSKWLLFTTI